MKWIWFLLFLVIVGELFDTIELADAAKKKKKKVTRKKKRAKAKAKRKGTTRRTTTQRPLTGPYDASQIFYSPMPYMAAPFIDNNLGGPAPVIGGPPGLAENPPGYTLPESGPVVIGASAAVRQKGYDKRTGWLDMTRQRRSVAEDAAILEHLGLIDVGKTKEFGAARPKRSFRLLKVAGPKGAGRTDQTETTATDENGNVTEPPSGARRRRGAELAEKRREVPGNRTRLEDRTNERNRPKMQQREKVKDKPQPKRDDVRERVNDRPTRDVGTAKSGRDGVQSKTQANTDEMRNATEKARRPKRDVKTQVDRAKEKMNTGRQQQEEKRKRKREKQEARRNARRNQTEPDGGRPAPSEQPVPPSLRAQVMPLENSAVRVRREINANPPTNLQALNADGDDSSSSEACSADSDEGGPVNDAEQVRLKRDVAQRGPDECTGADCSSEECVGEDCTYEDSDSDESAEEGPKVVAKRQVPEGGRIRREIPGPQSAGFGSGRRADLAAGCGDGGGDYGDAYDYGTGDYEEEQRRRGRRRRKNGRRGRNRNNRRRSNRNRTRPNRRQQASTSFDQATSSPYANPSSDVAPYGPFDGGAATPSPSFDFNSAPAPSMMMHALRKRELPRRGPTAMPSRTTTSTLGRAKRAAAQSTRPTEAGRGSGPPSDRNRNADAPNREGPKSGPVKEKEGRAPPSEPQGTRPGRPRRDLDATVLMYSPVPPATRTNDSSGAAVPMDLNDTLALVQLLQDAPPARMKREAPRPGNRDGQQGRGPPSDRQRNKPSDRQKRDTEPLTIMQSPVPVPLVVLPPSADSSNFTGVMSTMIPRSFQYVPPDNVKREAPERQPREPERTQGRGPPSGRPAPGSKQQAATAERPRRSPNLNSEPRPDGIQTRMTFGPADEPDQIAEVKKSVFAPYVVNQAASSDLSPPGTVSRVYKREAREDRRPNGQRRPEDGDDRKKDKERHKRESPAHFDLKAMDQEDINVQDHPDLNLVTPMTVILGGPASVKAGSALAGVMKLLSERTNDDTTSV